MFFIPLYIQDPLVIPVFAGTIPNITGIVDAADIETDFSGYFTDADTYSINSLEPGWSFNTSTGVLTIDTDYGITGPYMVTGINGTNEADSNEFYVFITFGASTAVGEQRTMSTTDNQRTMTTTDQNRTL